VNPWLVLVVGTALAAGVGAGWPTLPWVPVGVWLARGRPWPPSLALVLAFTVSGLLEWALIRRRLAHPGYSLRRLGWDVAALVAVGVTLGPRPGALLWVAALGPDAKARVPGAWQTLRTVGLARAGKLAAALIMLFLIGR
jgi:hypothetical protein